MKAKVNGTSIIHMVISYIRKSAEIVSYHFPHELAKNSYKKGADKETRIKE